MRLGMIGPGQGAQVGSAGLQAPGPSTIALDSLQRPKPLTDFYGEDRHELVQELAYQHWEQRGSPLGSPEIDWFAAEKAMRAYLLSSGIELGPDEDLYS
jgi:Protein of unknown function (DUF2934)